MVSLPEGVKGEFHTEITWTEIPVAYICKAKFGWYWYIHALGRVLSKGWTLTYSGSSRKIERKARPV